jgi:repressor LexA
MVKVLTQKQQQVFDYIKSNIKTKNLAPTLQNIASFLGTNNISTAQYYVDSLTKKGYLIKDHHQAHGLHLIPAKPTQDSVFSPKFTTKKIPLLGIIAAGKPIEPIEEASTIDIPNSIYLDNNNSYYALEVKGDSMIDMGILDGDIVIIKHQFTAESGEVIVAITESGATLKVLRKTFNKIFLEAKNPNYSPIFPVNLEIRGVCIGLIRNNS